MEVGSRNFRILRQELKIVLKRSLIEGEITEFSRLIEWLNVEQSRIAQENRVLVLYTSRELSIRSMLFKIIVIETILAEHLIKGKLAIIHIYGLILGDGVRGSWILQDINPAKKN